jgi:hypothetical protein
MTDFRKFSFSHAWGGLREARKGKLHWHKQKFGQWDQLIRIGAGAIIKLIESISLSGYTGGITRGCSLRAEGEINAQEDNSINPQEIYIM